jgi:predicted nicotinamide N-methyase
MRTDLENLLGGFGKKLARRRPPLCPEFEIWLLSDDVDLEGGCEELAEGEAPPFWAFCWGSGQALARHILDHPEIVVGKCVVDLGAGSGIAGLAAARAGAARVLALDLDPHARHATALNAELNALEIETIRQAPESWDLLLAADVLYETGLRGWVLGPARRRGPILLADPERTGTQSLTQPAFARVPAVTFPDVDSPRTSAALHWLPQLADESLLACNADEPPGHERRPTPCTSQ